MEDSVKISRTLAASLLMLVAAVISFGWLAAAYSRIPGFETIIRSHLIWVVSPLPFVGLAVGFGGNVLLSNIMALLYILSLPAALVGSITTIRRRMWALSLIGAIGAFIAVPLLGIPAIFLIFAARRNFQR